MIKRITYFAVALFVFFAMFSACSQSGEESVLNDDNDQGLVKVVATTSIVGDIVAYIGGDAIDLSVLLPLGADPHSFDPTPQDIAQIADADIVFANGAGLEEFLDNMIASAGAEDKVVYVSDGIQLLELGGDQHSGDDPHTWTDPNNVLVWVRNIEQALKALDPAHEASYTTQAEKYQGELEELDSWINMQVSQLPESNRKLVTDHRIFGYYAAQYGFEQIGALIPSFSTLAEPTAQELAEIEAAISEYQVKAIFVGHSMNPSLAERVAEDTGTQLVFVYTGSLSAPDSEAATYLDYMRYNTNAIVESLK